MSSKLDINDLDKIILDLNKSAIDELHTNNFPAAYDLLFQAKLHLKNKGKTQKVLKLKVITFNNFGCYYKRQGDLHKALSFLMQALSYEKLLENDSTNIAGTYLNLCSIHSELNNHSQALHFAIKAINSIEGKFQNNEHCATTLVIAYQNAGNEYNFLGKKHESSSFYEQGYEISMEYFGMNHELTRNLGKLCREDNSKIKNNPNIDRMLNYFRKHMGKKRNQSIVYSSTEEKPKKMLRVKHSVVEIKNKQVYERLQPIVNIKYSQFGSKKNNLSNSPSKYPKSSISPIKNPSISISVPAMNKKIDSISKKFITFQNKLQIFEKNAASLMKLTAGPLQE